MPLFEAIMVFLTRERSRQKAPARLPTRHQLSHDTGAYDVAPETPLLFQVPQLATKG